VKYVDKQETSFKSTPLSYAVAPGKRNWPAFAGAIIGILFASILLQFGLLGVWALIADWIDPHKDRSLVFNFILMAGFGLGAGYLIMRHCIRILRSPAGTSGSGNRGGPDAG
jgi:hypothetical protein